MMRGACSVIDGDERWDPPRWLLVVAIVIWGVLGLGIWLNAAG